jgi:lipopolysaccharide-induced tumor necrosis factor-alpha factor
MPMPQFVEVQRFPQVLKCPMCQFETVTTVQYRPGLCTWVASGTICVLGGFLGCCLIPFCVNSFKDARHSCSRCNSALATREAAKF